MSICFRRSLPQAGCYRRRCFADEGFRFCPHSYRFSQFVLFCLNDFVQTGSQGGGEDPLLIRESRGRRERIWGERASQSCLLHANIIFVQTVPSSLPSPLSRYPLFPDGHGIIGGMIIPWCLFQSSLTSG
jgi:hypothetical protein